MKTLLEIFGNMKPAIKKGDYVYATHYEIGTIPAKVVRVNRATITVNDGEKNYTLKKSNIELQSESNDN